MARGRTRRVLMFGLVACGLSLLVLHVLCLPLYSGASFRGTGGWRLEHGRVTVWRSAATAGEGFYVANNTEGLRWTPDGHVDSAGEWRVTVPLWMGWGAMFAGAGVLSGLSGRAGTEASARRAGGAMGVNECLEAPGDETSVGSTRLK